MAGIELANWTLRQAQEEGGPSVCLGAIQHQPEPQRLPELSAPVGVRLEASQEAAGQGLPHASGGPPFLRELRNSSQGRKIQPEEEQKWEQ